MVQEAASKSPNMERMLSRETWTSLWLKWMLIQLLQMHTHRWQLSWKELISVRMSSTNGICSTVVRTLSRNQVMLPAEELPRPTTMDSEDQQSLLPSSQAWGGDSEKLAGNFAGVLHHIDDEHEWLIICGECEHGTLEDIITIIRQISPNSRWS